jgi:putative tryptophan/tyrosine transport system substrate-binding protein
MAYAEDRVYMFRRAAEYVDKILKGAKPADLPIERPTKFQTGHQLEAGEADRLTIPQSVLYRADRVIK